MVRYSNHMNQRHFWCRFIRQLWRELIGSIIPSYPMSTGSFHQNSIFPLLNPPKPIVKPIQTPIIASTRNIINSPVDLISVNNIKYNGTPAKSNLPGTTSIEIEMRSTSNSYKLVIPGPYSRPVNESDCGYCDAAGCKGRGNETCGRKTGETNESRFQRGAEDKGGFSKERCS